MGAGELEIGDTIRTSDGHTGTVTSLAIVIEPQDMWNLTVDEAHTFFVGDGEWLVHNTCGDVNKNRFNGRNIFGDLNNGDPVSFASDLDIVDPDNWREWNNVIRLIRDDSAWAQAGGSSVRSRNVRVSNLETAANLLRESRGIDIDVTNTDELLEHLYDTGRGRTWFEIHPNEGIDFQPNGRAQTNNLPHIKWTDGRGISGHIFYGHPDVEWGIPDWDN